MGIFQLNEYKTFRLKFTNDKFDIFYNNTYSYSFNNFNV